MFKIEWKRKTSLNLINLLREYEELWNPGHPDYKNQEQRESALGEILSEIQIQIPEVEISDIKIKIHSLRSQYQRELRALKKLKEQGADKIRPSLWCFDELRFLSYITKKSVATNEGIDIKIVEKPEVIADVAWNRKNTLTLINMLEERVELWNREHPDFKNLKHKEILLNEILLEIQKEMPDARIDDIRDKIHMLRCQYRKEIRMLRKSNKKAVGIEEIKKPLLWCFEELKFLSHSKRKEVKVETKEEIELLEFVNQPSEMSGIVWSRPVVLTLIELLKEHEELWNPKYPGFKDRAQRDTAVRKIFPEIEKHMQDVSINDIRLKIHTLRSQYQRQLRALERLNRDRVEPDLIMPKLWCFYELQFLGDISSFENDESNKQLAEQYISKQRMRRPNKNRVENDDTNHELTEDTEQFDEVPSYYSYEDIEYDLFVDQQSFDTFEVNWIQIERMQEHEVPSNIEDINAINKDAAIQKMIKEASNVHSTEDIIVDIKIERQPHQIQKPTSNRTNNEAATHAVEESNNVFEFIAIEDESAAKHSVKSPTKPASIWNRKTTLALIQLLKEHECLWNPEHVGYKSKAQWSKALVKIFAGIQTQIPNIKIYDIKNKIHSLKSQYRRQIRIFLKTDDNGIADDVVTKPKLWCYDELDFLACSIRDIPEHEDESEIEIADKPPVITGVIWHRRTTLTLIQMLEERVELWNHEHPNFKDMALKEALLNEIVEEIRKVMPDVEIGDIKDKIHSLRCQYRREIAALKKSNMSTAVDADRIQRPKLWCFDELQFLSYSKMKRMKEQTEEEIALIELAKQSPEMPQVVWQRPIVLTLIELLKEHKVLWNTRHPDYRNKTKWEEAHNEILLQIQIQLPNAEISDIKEKIHSLQGQYRREIRTLKRLNRNGVKPGEIIRPKLWCFYQLQFLKDNAYMEMDKVELPVEKSSTIIRPAKESTIHVKRAAPNEVDVFAHLPPSKTGVDWNRTNTLHFIELLKEHESLWNLGHPDYKSLTKRDEALNELLIEIQNIMPDAELSHIKSKIHCLRSQYRREIRGLENADAEDIKRPRFWCFDELQFLSYSKMSRKKNQTKEEIALIELANQSPAMPQVVWQRPIVLTFIELLREHKVLWHIGHPDYRNKTKREEALNDILLQIQIQLPNAEISDIKEKIHSLQGQYRREIRTMKRLNRNGVKPGEVIRPKLWCFYELQFLQDNAYLEMDKVELPAEKSSTFIRPVKESTIHVKRAAPIEVDVFADLPTPIAGVDWNRTITLYFIELLKEHESLWNLGHPDYKSLAKRDEALNELLIEIQNIMPDAEMSHIKSKIHCLRSQYRREIRGLENSNAEVTKKPRLWCFDNLQFLGFSAYKNWDQLNQVKQIPRIEIEDEAEFDVTEEKKAQPFEDAATAGETETNANSINAAKLEQLSLAKRNVKIAAKQLAETKTQNSIQSRVLTEKRRRNETEREEVVGLRRMEYFFSQILKKRAKKIEI